MKSEDDSTLVTSTEDEDAVLVHNDEIQLRDLKDESTDERLTVDDALRKIGLGWYHLKWIPVIASSAFTQSSMVALAPLLMTELQCQWDLHTIHEVIILFVLFFGNCPGDILSGLLSDKKGRKVSLVFGQLLLLTWTVLSAAASSYKFFGMCYFFIGIAIGMLTFVTVVHLSEISPPNFRSYAVTMFFMFWALGALFSCVVSYLLLNSRGWMITTFVVAVPHLIVSILVLLVDESPKYLAVSGQTAAAEQVLIRMATQNKVELEIEGRLIVEASRKRGTFSDVIAPSQRKQLLLLFSLFFSAGFIVYSSYTMIPYMLENQYCYNNNNNNSTIIPEAEKCKFGDGVLKETALITTAEIIMIPIFAFVNELFGRIKTLRLLAGVMFISSLFLVFCIDSTIFVACLYLQRGSVQSLSLILFIYAPESFPTHIRGLSCGLTVGGLFVGGLLSSCLVYPVGVLHSFAYLTGALTAAALLALACVFGLQTETRGADLP